MVKMACHCREDAATVQLLKAIISAVISPSRLAGMCHRRLVPVVFVLRDNRTTTKTVRHCILSSKITAAGAVLYRDTAD